MTTVPLIDISDLVTHRGDATHVADAIGSACRDSGFFYVSGHGVDEGLSEKLDQLCRQFFAQDLDSKMSIPMAHGGRAWRGYFPVGNELTLGQPDQKEGLYFGAELDNEHPKVQARVPLHGRNLFPAIPQFKETVLAYLDAMTSLGHKLMEGIALSLGLEASYFADRYTGDPLILFRVFHYPPLPTANPDSLWSVGEHTDYGLLTILRQDAAGGLQVKSGGGWIDAPPIEGSFVVNIGDMLDRMTGGRYRSTPHRVRNRSALGRLSFPFFFDPNFDAQVQPIDPQLDFEEDRADRWDQSSVHDFNGTYGDYILEKVSKVFPELGRDAL